MHTSTSVEEKNVANDFLTRQKLLSDQLQSAELLYKDKIKSTRASPETEQLSDKNNKYKRQFQALRGKESIFKRPSLPAPRSRNIQNMYKHPTKWTYYNLANVSADDMSDKTNTLTAFAFLEELQKRKLQESQLNESEDMEIATDEGMEDKKSVITFRKPAKETEKKKDCQIVAKNTKPTYRNSKLVMPDYIVGSPKVQKEKKVQKKIDRTECKKELVLDHLQMDDEENV